MTLENKKDSKFAMAAVLLAGAVGIGMYSRSRRIKESFTVGSSYTWKVNRVAPDGCGNLGSVSSNNQASLSSVSGGCGQTTSCFSQAEPTACQQVNTHPAAYKTPSTYIPRASCDGSNKFFTVPGTWESSLSPRFSNTDYGAHIRYNMPANQDQAVPSNPLTYGKMVKENYCPSATTPPACGKAGSQVGSCGQGTCSVGVSEFDTAAYVDAQQAMSQTPYVDATDMLPVGDMCGGVSASPEQPIIYDRFIYANQRSRLQGLGDRIRGDLPIVPCLPDSNPSSGVWFRPSVTPHIDLTQGALNVMGGSNNETSHALKELMQASVAGTLPAFGGTPNVAVMKGMSACAGGGDLQVTSFP